MRRLLVLTVLAACGRPHVREAAPAGPVCPGGTPSEAATPQRPPRQLIQTRSTGAPAALAVSDQGLLATIDALGDVRVWDIARRALIGSQRHPALHDASGIVWDADGRRFAVLTRRVPEYTRVTWLDATARAVAAPTCSPDGLTALGNASSLHWIATGTAGISVLDPATCARVPLAVPPGVPPDAALHISRDGTTLAAQVIEAQAPGSTWRARPPEHETLIVWPFGQPAQARRVPIKPHHGNGAFILGPSGAFAIVARGMGPGLEDTENPHRLAFVPLDGSGEARSFAELPHYPLWLDMSGDGRLIAGVSTRSSVAVVQVSSIATRSTLWERSTFTLDGNIPASASFVGSWLVVVTMNGPIYVFDAETGRLYGQLGATMPSMPTSLELVRPDVLATTSRDRVTLWSLRDGRVLQREHVRAARAVALSPAGDLMIAQSPDHWVDPTFGHTGRRDAEWIQSTLAAERWAKECAEDSWPLYLDTWKGLAPSHPGSDPLDGEPVALPSATFPPSRLGKRCLRGSRIEQIDLAHGLALVEAGNDELVHDLASGKDAVLRDVPGYRSFRFSSDGQRLVSYAAAWIDQTDVPLVDVWDPRTGALVTSWRVAASGIGRPSRAGAYAISGDAGTIAAIVSGERGTALVVRDLGAGKTHVELPFDEPPSALAFGVSPRDLFVGTLAGEVIVVHDGREVARGTSDGGGIASMAFAGTALVTISADGAVRLWDPATATERVALVAFEDDESLAFTPHGAYVGTREASDRVVWVFDDPVEPFRFSQFAESYDRPDAVARRMAGEDVDVAVTVGRPPLAPAIVAATASGSTGHIRAHVHAGRQVRSLDAFVDGRPVVSKLACTADGDVDVEVPLLAGANSIALAADDDRGLSSNPTTIRLDGTAVTERPDLWVIAIGVDHYPNLAPAFQLGFAAADARGIADVFASQAGPGRPYAAVHRRVLTDGGVTIDSVRAALGDLSQMRPQDVAIVFFGGHGVKPAGDEDMVFVTGSVKALDPDSLRASGIGWTQIGTLVAGSRGRVLVLLDACHSGDVAGDVVQNGELAASLMRDRRAGAVVFAAAKGRQLSYEPNGSRGFAIAVDSRKLVETHDAHGYFTGAVLQSLATADTDADRDGVIEMSELFEDVSRRVSAATVGHQTPWIARREIFGDFGVAAPPPGTAPAATATNWDDEPSWDGAEHRALEQLERAKKAHDAKRAPSCDEKDPLCVP